MRVVSIVPTYNEAENIEAMLLVLAQVAKLNNKHKFAILVVDDNSPDGTGGIVRGIQSKYKDIYLLKGKKRGLGVAMVRGIKYALKTLKADVAITNEADFALELKHIPAMLKKIEAGYDVVIASRHLQGGKTHGWTWERKINHWIANTFFATWVAGVSGVSDHNMAFRAVRAKILRRMNWTKMPVGFGFFNYWLFKMTQVTEKICEMPVTYKFRTKGESKVSLNSKYLATYLRDVGEYIWICLKIRWEGSG